MCDHEMMSSWVIDAVATVGILTCILLQSILQIRDHSSAGMRKEASVCSVYISGMHEKL